MAELAITRRRNQSSLTAFQLTTMHIKLAQAHQSEYNIQQQQAMHQTPIQCSSQGWQPHQQLLEADLVGEDKTDDARQCSPNAAHDGIWQCGWIRVVAPVLEILLGWRPHLQHSTSALLLLVN